jgi:hypothetical protein
VTGRDMAASGFQVGAGEGATGAGGAEEREGE